MTNSYALLVEAPMNWALRQRGLVYFLLTVPFTVYFTTLVCLILAAAVAPWALLGWGIYEVLA